MKALINNWGLRTIRSIKRSIVYGRNLKQSNKIMANGETKPVTLGGVCTRIKRILVYYSPDCCGYCWMDTDEMKALINNWGLRTIRSIKRSIVYGRNLKQSNKIMANGETKPVTLGGVCTRIKRILVYYSPDCCLGS